jgi:hypothetical protein
MLALAASPVRSQIAGTPESGDRLGSTLAGGDFNGDGIQDLAVGGVVEGVLPDRAVVVIYGTADGLLHEEGQWLRQRDLGETQGAHDVFGSELVTADFDNDGFGDLVIGVRSKDIGEAVDSGSLYILFGSASGLSSTRMRYLDSINIGNAANGGALFSSALAIENVNGDAYPDLLVEVPGDDLPSSIGARMAFVLYGMPGGLSPAPGRRVVVR